MIKSDEYYATHDFRFVELSTRNRVSWRETVQALCYGNHGGRWHDLNFWIDLKLREPSMTDAECEQEVRGIEKRADLRLEEWRMYQ